MMNVYCWCMDCTNTECTRHYSHIDKQSSYSAMDLSVCCLAYRKEDLHHDD